MPRARDEAGNEWEVDAQGKPIRLLKPAAGATGQVNAPPDYEYKAPQAGAELDRTRTSTAGQQIDNQFDSATLPARVRKAGAEATAAELEADKKRRESGALTDDQRQTAGKYATLDSIIDQINRTQDLYNQEIGPETFGNGFGILDNVGPRGARFNAAGQGVADQGLNAFRTPGVGSQSDFEAKQFATANTPQAGDWDAQIEEKLSNMRRRVDANRNALGLPPAKWTGLPDQDQAIAAQSGIAGAGTTGGGSPGAGAPSGGGGMSPPPLSPGDPSYQAATGAGRTIADPQASAQLDKLIRSGASIDQINQFAQSKGLMPVDPNEVNAAREYLRKNPGYKGLFGNAKKYEPLSSLERGITKLGDNAVGAYAMGAGNFLSGNTLDNIAPDPARARLAAAMAKAQSPTATTLGEVSGGAMAGLTGEAGLARLGMGSRIGRGVLADAMAGGANGAGGADNGSRMLGAIKGAAASGLGSAAGTLAARGVARALTPTGGRLAPLYASGVRPTPGQRFADSGTAGRLLNTAEEALQSVPVVGASIRGAREGARDQFQVGAFNQALAEVGETLPRGMGPGTDPHKYAQTVFNRVYNEARGGMRVVADEKLSNDLAGLAPDIATLGPAARARLKTILNNSVDNRTKNSQMSGDGYKQAVSDLGKHIERHRKGAMAEDQNLADVLEGVRSSLDSAARRHSDPEAVALLDAADAGYAKLVRVEEAASRRGGDQGTFSPTQFDSAVQKTSGRVRSKAYLRGDAQMQDYARAGKNLVDKLPNSGTADRAMIGMTATGGLGAGTAAGMVDPTALTALAGVGAAYAPGVRKLTTGMLSPSVRNRKAIAERLRKRARLIGATAGSGALGMLPDQ